MSRNTVKKVSFGARPTPVPVAKEADSWVGKPTGEPIEDRTLLKEAAQPASSEPMKRLTIDVTDSLHRRMKVACATRGLKMADVMRELLEKEFPAGQGA